MACPDLSSTGIPTRCAICDTLNEAEVLYPAKLVDHSFDEQRFSARIFYDQQVHHRIVQCKHCGLIRSDPITIDQTQIQSLYQRSHLTYEHEIPNARKTYGFYLSRLVGLLPSRETLLEIGCGNGFFLEEAFDQGFQKVFGVEPSLEAVGKASSRVRSGIRVGMFHRDMFPGDFFDVICIFQTLDHFLDPSSVVSDCFRLLKPGGAVLAINHNVKWYAFRLLGEKSPIIDVQHPYLFDPSTMRKLFEKHRYTVLDVRSIKNTYSIGYLFSLAPLRPAWLKTVVYGALVRTGLARVPVRLPIGNIALIAQKPAEE